MATTVNMNLALPVVTVTIGPDWASALNVALEVVDQHDHSSGKGVKVRSAGLNIDADVNFNTNNRITLIKSIQLAAQNSALTGATNANSVYSVNGNLYFTNNSGSAVQITTGGSIVSSPSALEVVDYTVVNTDLSISAAASTVLMAVDTSAARNITLPLAANVSAGRIYIVKDATGAAFQNNIIISTAGGDFIDLELSYTVNSGCASVWFVSNGANTWHVL